MIKVIIYDKGNPEPKILDTNAGVVEIVLEDERTAQMVFLQNGALKLRAWSNRPILLGNSTCMNFETIVPFEEALDE